MDSHIISYNFHVLEVEVEHNRQHIVCVGLIVCHAKNAKNGVNMLIIGVIILKFEFLHFFYQNHRESTIHLKPTS
jgi:hypothetical protein